MTFAHRPALSVRALACLLVIGGVTAISAGCETIGASDEFTEAYDGYLNKCASCHAPAAPGATAGTESSLDFSTVDTARASMRGGKAKGLTGNFASCNSVAFVVAGQPAQSLLMAVLDEDVRQNFDTPGHSGCDSSAISDMTIRVGGPDATAIAQLKTWIENGAL